MRRFRLFVNYSPTNFFGDFRFAPRLSPDFSLAFMRAFKDFVANLKTRRCSGRRTISKAAEVWQALFHERFHALFLILGSEGAMEQPALILDAVRQ